MIEITDFSFKYQNQPRWILKNINLKITEGEFILLTGASGSGKSTLVRVINGLIPYFYGGELTGKVVVNGTETLSTSLKRLSPEIGFIFQNPENQLFMSDVKNEIAFGLENLGISREVIHERIEEIIDLVGIEDLVGRSLNTLSGGEKQKVAIASILAMRPSILILDEPTAELDPDAAKRVLDLVADIFRKTRMTIILIEHRIDRVLHYVDRAIIMKEGMIHQDGNPAMVFSSPLDDLGILIPPCVQVGKALNIQPLPLDLETLETKLRETIPTLAPQTTTNHHDPHPKSHKPPRTTTTPIQNPTNHTEISKNYNKIKESRNPLMVMHDVSFGYEPNLPVLQNLSMQIYRGEFIGLVGPNGSGKTTLLKLLNGILKPTQGHILFKGEDIKKKSIAQLAEDIGYIFQNPSIQFYQDTVEEEVEFILKQRKLPEALIQTRVAKVLNQFDLEKYRSNYPRYLSIGEQQKIALASIIVNSPQILLLDEPTHGMDYGKKQELYRFLNEYNKQGNAVILASHDMESIAQYADRVIYVRETQILDDGDTRSVIASHPLLQTQMAQLSLKIWGNKDVRLTPSGFLNKIKEDTYEEE